MLVTFTFLVFAVLLLLSMQSCFACLNFTGVVCAIDDAGISFLVTIAATFANWDICFSIV